MYDTVYGNGFLNRFDKLISRNVSVQIESDLHLRTKEESLNWLNLLTSTKMLGAVFIVNQVLFFNYRLIFYYTD